nr:uncharacterized protein LOC112721056 [Arachis hypogaea]
MDRNTRYFHHIASTRRMNKRINALRVNGRIVWNQARIKIDGAEVEALEAMPSVEEIREAVLDCESSKAPGSDGYNMNFIKQCWEEISQKFTAAVMGFFQSAKIPTNANVTWVTLAPKFVGANEIKDFRPISMVGCVYKVISKVLVRRLRTVMPGLVGETYTIFVKGRKIHDDTLIACETVQWLKAHRKKAAIIKIDVQKAYDRVRMLGEAIRNGCINPLLIGRDHIELSYLQFADDTILFCPPETETIVNYKRLLRCFELMSGLSINFDKSNLILANYKVEEKLNLWKVKVLNKAGKLVLIKSVLNSLPIYYLSLYKMPKAVADKLITLQRRFLWCKEDGNNGIPLVKWEVVQAPKKAGGLGVGDAVLKNTALLFKWWWRFFKEDCPLWKKIVCSCNNLNPKVMLFNQTLPVKGDPWKEICQLDIKAQQVLQSETLSEEITSYSFTSSIWKGLVPPRIELFGWFVGRVWCVWLRCFHRDWAVPGSIKGLFESWNGTPNRKEEQKRWLTGFFVVIWNVTVDVIQNKTFLSYKEWTGIDPTGC